MSHRKRRKKNCCYGIMSELLKQTVNQLDVPFVKREFKFAPWIFYCDGKIVKYNSSGFKIWRALVSISHTLLSDSHTWELMLILVFTCMLTMGIVMLSGHYRSIEDTNSVVSRILTLISFIFSAFVMIIVNRWDRARNTELGQLWGALENLNLMVFRILSYGTQQEHELSERVIRYSRLCLKLTFMASQNDGDLEPLRDTLLLDKELQWLNAALIGTRPLVVVIWLSELFDSVLMAKYKCITEVHEGQIATNIASLRGGIGALLGAIGTQLPYPYIHIVYWTIQILLFVLAVETGVNLATDVYFRVNGRGEYSPPDDNVQWPQDPNTWYVNTIFQMIIGNAIFVLFCAGFLKICDKNIQSLVP